MDPPLDADGNEYLQENTPEEDASLLVISAPALSRSSYYAPLPRFVFRMLLSSKYNAI